MAREKLDKFFCETAFARDEEKLSLSLSRD